MRRLSVGLRRLLVRTSPLANSTVCYSRSLYSTHASTPSSRSCSSHAHAHPHVGSIHLRPDISFPTLTPSSSPTIPAPPSSAAPRLASFSPTGFLEPAVSSPLPLASKAKIAAGNKGEGMGKVQGRRKVESRTTPTAPPTRQATLSPPPPTPPHPMKCSDGGGTRRS